MLRRDFFKAFSLAAAAIATGSTALAAPRVFAPKRPSLPPPASDTLSYIQRLLKECRVTGHSVTMCVGELTRTRVTYRHDPNCKRTAEDLAWEEHLADAKIVNVVVTTTAEYVDVTNMSVVQPAYDIEIEYITPMRRSQR